MAWRVEVRDTSLKGNPESQQRFIIRPKVSVYGPAHENNVDLAAYRPLD
jgi:hypothetical protein